MYFAEGARPADQTCAEGLSCDSAEGGKLMDAKWGWTMKAERSAGEKTIIHWCCVFVEHVLRFMMDHVWAAPLCRRVPGVLDQ